MIDILTQPLTEDDVALNKKRSLRLRYIWSIGLTIFSIAILVNGLHQSALTNDLSTGLGIFNLVMNTLLYSVCFGFQIYFTYGLVYKRDNEYNYVKDLEADLTESFIAKLALKLFKESTKTPHSRQHDYLNKPSNRYPEVVLFKKKVDQMGRPLTLIEYRSIDAWMKAKDLILK